MKQNSAFNRHIKNIVYVMFENRSFDTLLGWMHDGHPKPPDIKYIPADTDKSFRGLTDKFLQEFAQPLKTTSDPNSTVLHPIVRGVQGNFLPCSTPIADPHEKFQFVTKQIYGDAEVCGDPAMKGFLQDYYEKHPDLPIHHEILQTYDFNQAPIINSLASNYGVSDEWFSSIPSQTSINRAFSLKGDSVGYMTAEDEANKRTTAMVNNHQWGGPLDKNPAPFVGKTIWNVLADHGHKTPSDWKIYYSDHYLNGWLGDKTSYTYLMFQGLQDLLAEDGLDPSKDPHLQNIDAFYNDAKKGQLPRFSYIEPKYTWEEYAGVGIHGDDYHPPSDIGKGEALLRDIYNCLIASPQWENTLLIVAFDEHGGTFDHVRPPNCAIDPGNADCNERDFGFNRYGVRVPMLFISPWVKSRTVIRSDRDHPFDHTSWLATLLTWYDLDPSLLGKRTACAPTFDDVITDQMRDTFELPPLADCAVGSALDDHGASAELAEFLSRFLKAAKPDADQAEALKQMLANCQSEQDLYDFVKKAQI